MTGRLVATVLVGACAVIGLGRFELRAWVLMVVLTAAVGTALLAAVLRHGTTAGVNAGSDRTTDRRWAGAVFSAAVLMRLLLLPAGHYLSDDAFRYHWDGKVVAAGLNPYLHAPASEAVAHLRSHAIDSLINHPDVVTVYPPYAELVFALGYLLSPGRLLGFQMLVLLSELIAWSLLYREIGRRGLPRANLLVAAWLPLVVLESYLPGHTEALALPFVVLFFTSVVRGQAYRAGVALGLACLVKPVALIFVPAALRELGPLRSLRIVPGLAGSIGVFYLPFLDAGGNLTSSMLLMARKWAFNGSLAPVLSAIVPEPALRQVLLALLALGVLGGTVWGRDLLSRARLALLSLVIVTPVLYPWYLIWAVPLLVLRPDPALVALTALAPLAHVAVIDLYTNGIWDPPLWPSVVSYTVFYALLALGAWRALRARITGLGGLG